MDDEQKPLLVLCVEDDDVLRMLIELSLKLDPGISVRLSGASQDAIELWTAGLRPDVILVDFLMPVIGGVEMIKRLKELAHEELPPVIFITATSSRSDHGRMIEAGAAGIIMKPFDPISLAQQVRALLPRGGPS